MAMMRPATEYRYAVRPQTAARLRLAPLRTHRGQRVRGNVLVGIGCLPQLLDSLSVFPVAD